MHQTASNNIVEHQAPVWRSLMATAVLGTATVALGHLGWHLAGSAVTLDARVAVVVLGLGALAGSVLTVGTALLATAAAARAVGHTARVVELASTRLTPRLLRRVLVAGLGAGLAGLGGPALADSPPDLGWQVTEQTLEAPLTATDGPDSLDSPSAAVPVVVTAPARDDASAQASTPAPVPAPAPAPDTVVVSRGDCLWSIAAAHLPTGSSEAEIAAAWPRWYAANRETIGADPDLILPGQRLTIPDGATS